MLNKYGYHYRQARRKGLLTENDLKLRIKKKDIKKRYGDGVWSSRICFYFDAKHFIHKTSNGSGKGSKRFGLEKEK